MYYQCILEMWRHRGSGEDAGEAGESEEGQYNVQIAGD